MALTILDYDKKVQNIPTRNISGQNNLGKLTKTRRKVLKVAIERAKVEKSIVDLSQLLISVDC